MSEDDYTDDDVSTNWAGLNKILKRSTVLWESSPAILGTSEDQDRVELSRRIANKDFRQRCRLLEIDPDTRETAPMLWWLTEAEMREIVDGLGSSSGPVALVLREQIKGALESIRLLQEKKP